MRHRLETGLSDRADIYRREKTGENEIGQPTYGWTPIAEDVPCQFDDESTSFVRGDSGERVQRPASVTFTVDVGLEEDDRLQFDAASGWYAVAGVDETRDHRRGAVVSVEAELQEADAPEGV